jgi:hypothetical protein
VDDVFVASSDDQTSLRPPAPRPPSLCPLCSERPTGIDGICPACWLTLAKLEDGNRNVIDVTVRDVFIEL